MYYPGDPIPIWQLEPRTSPESTESMRYPTKYGESAMRGRLLAINLVKVALNDDTGTLSHHLLIVIDSNSPRFESRQKAGVGGGETGSSSSLCAQPAFSVVTTPVTSAQHKARVSSLFSSNCFGKMLPLDLLRSDGESKVLFPKWLNHLCLIPLLPEQLTGSRLVHFPSRRIRSSLQQEVRNEMASRRTRAISPRGRNSGI